MAHPVSEFDQSVAVESHTPSGWLNRSVVGMAVASFFSDAGHEMATAILPLFLISIGAPPAALGIIEGLADATASFVKMWAGWLSDRLERRKRIAVIGYTLTGITTGMFALATAWPFVLVARMAGWFGRGMRGPVRDAMLAESVAPAARGRAFGFHRAGDTLGAVVGPVIAVTLISLLGAGGDRLEAAYRDIFWISLVPGLFAALSFVLLVHERRRPAPSATNLFRAVGNLPRRFKLFLVGVAIFGAGDFAHSLLILRATDLLEPSLGPTQAGQLAVGLYVLHNVLYAGMSLPIGTVADRIGKRILLVAGYAAAALMGLGWIVVTPSIAWLALLFALGGIFIAAEDTLEGALAADLLPEPVRGTGYGVLATVNGIGDFASSIVVGALWTGVSPAAGFAYASLLFGLGAIVIYRLR